VNKFFCLFLIFSLQLVGLTPIKLDNTLVRNMDGNLIDGSAIMMQKQVLVSISNIVYGKKGVGLIKYCGRDLTLQKIALEEISVNKILKSQYSTDIKSAFHSNFEGLSAEVRRQVEGLRNAFLDAKQQFKDATFPFLDKIQHFKDPVLRIMDECCKKRNRTNSHILKWADAPSGGEEALFHSIITTNNELYVFLYDIMVFINDLSHNCPKANEQFNKFMKEKVGKV
jgi:hypothetical protein